METGILNAFESGMSGMIGDYFGNVGVVRRKFMGAAALDFAFGAHFCDVKFTSFVQFPSPAEPEPFFDGSLSHSHA